jgi:hypothetical protein
MPVGAGEALGPNNATRGNGTDPARGPTLEVALAYVAADAAIATAAHEFLTAAGAATVAPRPGVRVDGLVVLLSRAALQQGAWAEAVAAVPADRVAPVRVDAIDPAQVPEGLRRLNWIDWQPDNPRSTFGAVLAGLYSNPERVRLSRQLAREAQAWHQRGRTNELLIHDHDRALRMRDLLAELEADPLAAPSALTPTFVEASVHATRRIRRRRRGWRIAAAVAALVGITTVLSALPEIAARSRINHAAIVTTGNDAVLASLPDWSAANASALLIEGTEQQRELGRSTLIEALGRPWQISSFEQIDSVSSMVPYAGGRRGALVAVTKNGSGLALVDVKQGTLVSYRLFPRRFDYVDVSPDGSTAAVAGRGAGHVDLETGQFRSLTARRDYAGVRALSKTKVAVWTEGGRLEVLRAPDAAARAVGTYAGVRDVLADGHGGGAALVSEGPGRFAIINALDGGVVTNASVPPGGEVGSLSPNGRRAIVEGGDGQLWTFGVRERPRPTGIVAPVLLHDLLWTTGGRLVIASDSERGQVVLLPDGEPLGHVCWNSPDVSAVRVDARSGVLACEGSIDAFWSVPRGPRAAVPRGQSKARSARGSLAQVDARGDRIRVRFRGNGKTRTTGWLRLGIGRIAALALDPDSRQLLAGGEDGGVATLGLTERGVRTLVRWQSPDASPVVSVGWDSGPTVTTASGHSWTLPSCPRCETDEGLLAAARERFTGCRTERQLQWVSDDVRRRLGLRTCPPVASLAER